jgi:hypothetical protein
LSIMFCTIVMVPHLHAAARLRDEQGAEDDHQVLTDQPGAWALPRDGPRCRCRCRDLPHWTGGAHAHALAEVAFGALFATPQLQAARHDTRNHDHRVFGLPRRAERAEPLGEPERRAGFCCARVLARSPLRRARMPTRSSWPTSFGRKSTRSCMRRRHARSATAAHALLHVRTFLRSACGGRKCKESGPSLELLQQARLLGAAEPRGRL